MKKLRVVVAMSGGVDSSVVAAMLVEAGYDVIGVTMRLYSSSEFVKRKGACCAGEDIYDARNVASKLKIPHYILNYESIFHENVISDFVNSYVAGETPIPCVRCNQSVKFVDMLKFAKNMNADYLATGHYIQKKISKVKFSNINNADNIDNSGDITFSHDLSNQNLLFQTIREDGLIEVNNDLYISQLYRGAYVKKDQSYFLFTITQKQLNYLLFPLGSQDKTYTRELAEKYGLSVFDKPDSQDICFVPGGDYRSIVKKYEPKAFKEGDIRMKFNDEVLGKHNGIINYTIGQRKGLNISYSEPLYVIEIDAVNNIVYVGTRENLRSEIVHVKELNWINNELSLNQIIEVNVKLRSVDNGYNALMEYLGDGKAIVKVLEPCFSVTPGQACVMYKENQLLGGGWIYKNTHI